MKKGLVGTLIGTVAVATLSLGLDGNAVTANASFRSPTASGILEELRTGGLGRMGNPRGAAGDGEISEDDASWDTDWGDEDNEEIYEDDDDDWDDWDDDDDPDPDPDPEKDKDKGTIEVKYGDDGTIYINIIGDNNKVKINNYYDKRKSSDDDSHNDNNNNNDNGGGDGGSGGGGCVVETPDRNVSNNVVPAFDCFASKPVGQGGKLILNGCLTNATLTVRKTDDGMVSNARGFAGTLGGQLINVVHSSAPGVRYNRMDANFYVPDVNAGDRIGAYLLDKRGAWQPLTVTEVRKDHVVVILYETGTIAFVKLPALAVK